MCRTWKIVYYRNRRGSSSVYDFIEAAQVQEQAKMYNSLELLEEFGIGVRPLFAKKLTVSGIWELRIVGNDSIRILYAAASDKTFVLLHAFYKKKQKIDRKDVQLAERRLQEFKSRY